MAMLNNIKKKNDENEKNEKILALIIVVAIALSLVACGGAVSQF